MKLSEAIRLGAMLRPQGRFLLQSSNGTCALGAAMEAVGARAKCDQMYPGRRERERWPILVSLVGNPAHGYTRRRTRVETVISVLNDQERWTREAIADWVATIEAQQDTAQPQPAPVAVEA